MLNDLTLIIPAKGERDIAHAARLRQRAPVPTIVVTDLPYGAAIKAGIQQATTPLVATMDADGQHDMADLTLMADIYQFVVSHGEALDMMIGLRKSWRDRVANVGLNLFASALAGQWVPDLGSGLRVFNRTRAWGYRTILPDGFAFNAALTMAFAADRYVVQWWPVASHPRKWGRSAVRPLQDGAQTVWTLFVIGSALRTRTPRAALRRLRSRSR